MRDFPAPGEPREQQTSALERHTQTLLLVMCAAGISWFAKNSYENSVNIGSILASQVGMQKDISQMYRADSAQRDRDDENRDVGDLKTRVGAVESSLNARTNSSAELAASRRKP